MKKTAIAVVTVCALFSTAHAEDFKFSYDKELLTSSTGVEKVYDRLERRAKRYCGVIGSSRSLQAILLERKCVEETVETAIEAIDSPALANLHNNTIRVAKN